MANIITTVGGSDANSYVTIAEFKTYCEGVWPVPAAASQADGVLTPLLITAARVMNGFSWIGCKAASTQKLAWPQYDVEDPDTDGNFASDTIPQRVKDAQCELALALYNKSYSPNNDKAKSIKSWQTDGVRIDYDTSNTLSKNEIPASVMALIGPLLAGNRLALA